MVSMEVRFRSKYTLQGRLGRLRGKANAVVNTLDPFSIDASAEIVRGTDAEFVAWMRATVDGTGVAGATGTLRLWCGGCEVFASPYTVPADSGRGDGFMAVTISGDDIMARGYYRWVLIATKPGGGQARAEGSFRLP